MTAKEKAQELVAKFTPHARLTTDSPVSRISHGKICAIIAVDEIIESFKPLTGIANADYWKQVKQEINSL